MKKTILYITALMVLSAAWMGCKRESDYIPVSVSPYISNFDLRSLYKGADLPLTVSIEGAAKQRFRELRDPAVFEENGKLYLLYTVAAESGIAIGELKVR